MFFELMDFVVNTDYDTCDVYRDLEDFFHCSWPICIGIVLKAR